MATTSQVQPLRITKSHSGEYSPSSSTMAPPRPLSEIGSTERRRNSPSYNQATRKMIVSREASPYTENSFVKDSSPRSNLRNIRDIMAPPRFDIENTPEPTSQPSTYQSPTRRASIERLKQAGRVKTSNIFALETKTAYDPMSLPIVERPSSNRPLSHQFVNNSFTRFDSMRKENTPLRRPLSMSSPQVSRDMTPPASLSTTTVNSRGSPTKGAGSPSPTKSSLSRTSKYASTLYDPENAHWSGSSSEDEVKHTPRGLRQNKSVTFHDEPPVINEYEQPTPEPSISAPSDSREGSWDSEEFEDHDYSFERGSSAEQQHHDDSFDEDLENMDKTPVVLPEQWSRVSPEEARTDLVDAEDDVFGAGPTTTTPSHHRRILSNESIASDLSESRPLPPIPGTPRGRRLEALQAAAERAGSVTKRGLPTPPQQRGACTRDDILSMAEEMIATFDERDEPMNLHGGEADGDGTVVHRSTSQEKSATAAESDHAQEHHVATDIGEESFAAGLDDFDHSPPRISRESILRKVRSRRFDLEDAPHYDSFNAEDSFQPSYADLDPDVPIPSREMSEETMQHYVPATHQATEQITVHDVIIKEEPTDDDGIDMAAIPEATDVDVSFTLNHIRESSVVRRPLAREDEDDSEVNDDSDRSRYSTLEPEAESTVLHAQHDHPPEPESDGKETLHDAMQLLTVKDYSQPQPRSTSVQKEIATKDFMGLGLPTFTGSGSYDFGVNKFISTPSPPPSSSSREELVKQKFDITAAAPSLPPPSRPASKWDLPAPKYDGAEYRSEWSPPGTPESVIHRSADDIPALADGEQLGQVQQGSRPVSPVEQHAVEHDDHRPVSPLQSAAVEQVEPEVSIEIPERRATIKTGGKLKTRPSATPADLRAMAEQRRMVSAECDVPEPERNDVHESMTAEMDHVDEARHNSSAIDLSLEVPALDHEEGLGLDEEFDRVIEKGTKGYLTRKNPKVVIASNRNFSNESNATFRSLESAAATTARQGPKARHAKRTSEQVLKTEPWNGSTRRQSQRLMSSCPTDTAPPLAGQKAALDVVEEDFAAGTSSLADDVGEDVERGRLFVKVVGIKDLELPLPRSEPTHFQLTLDNGLHCVTTSDIRMGETAAIGQEFELVVLNDLEFQMTLTTTLTPPPKTSALVDASSPTKKAALAKSSGALSRFLTSPKKRAEKERLEREALEAEERRRREEIQRKRASVQPTAWDLLHELVNAADGSFARAYVNLRAHEKACFGRPLLVDIPCYNEWALEQDSAVINSVRSKRGHSQHQPIRRPPYVVAKLQLQLLYIPKPKDAVEEDLPKSMSAAVREITRADKAAAAAAAELEAAEVEVTHEGHLSQQGGDCQHWRRRFFRLQGPKLTAYHEHTHQKRAVINLSKASRLVDDKSTLVADPAGGVGQSRSKRRKSAFAEEDEGYAYVEEGFRIRFANGETIDFYADAPADKAGWMEKLALVIGRPSPAAAEAAKAAAAEEKKRSLKWTDLVHARERAESEKDKLAQQTEVVDFAAAAASTPVVPATSTSVGPPVPDKDSLRRPSTPPMSERRGHRNRSAVKSMIF